MKHLWRKIVSVILALAMVILCLPENVVPVKTALAAQGDPNVQYVDENGNTVTLAGSQYTLLETTGTSNWDGHDNRPRTWGVSGQTTYYVVGVNERSQNNDKRVTYGSDQRVTVAGDVVLILPDISGSSDNTYGINLKAGITVSTGASLTIYGGPNGGCSLTATGNNGYYTYYSGIGGYRNYTNVVTCGTIRIYGGTVNATGGNYAAGIGDSYSGRGGNIIIGGGTVTAKGGLYAAGIGGGEYGDGGNVTITGGTVKATGGTYGAGIGSGYGSDSTGAQDITISGGTVTAVGGTGASGIGCGMSSVSCGKITISGGTVDATPGSSYKNGNASSIYTAAIGGRFSSGDKITISGGNVTTHLPSEGPRYVTGIGAIYAQGNSNIEITGGVIVANGKTGSNAGVGIGDGINGTGGKVSINITEDGDSVTATSYRGTVTLVSPVTDVTSNPNQELNAGRVSNLSAINGKKLVKRLTYTIKFVDYNGETLQAATQVAPGVRPTYNGVEPKRNPSQEFSYEFSGWKDDDGNTYAKGKQLPAATKSVTYTATYSETKNYYKVKFVDDDDTVLLAEKSYPYGTEVEDIDKPADPTKEDDKEHTYQFNGWTPSLEKVTRDVVYKATYSESPRKYSIKFVNYNGSELATYQVAYGVSPEYKGETPAHQASTQYTFTFFGWEDQNGEQYGKSEVLPTVGGEMTYKAIFTTTVNEYSVKFIDDDGSTIKEAKNYPYGTAAADIEKPANPFKDADDDWEYAFAGWTPEIAEVTGDVVYKATYTKTKREYRDLKVAISWIDEDDRDGIRPESYTLEFYTSDLPDQELTFSEENGWSMTLRVPLRDVKGKPISFGFEVTHPDGYSCYVNHPNTFSYVYEFTHETAKVSLTVKKVWDDLGNAYGTRPDELKVSLSDGTKTVKEVTLNAENGWSATVTDLPMYQNHGQEVVYSWTEEAVTGYKLSKNETEGNITTITNKLETVRISGQVKWEMNGYSKSLIPDGVNVLILEVGEQVDSIAVPRVDSETVWEYTSKELPKYTSGGDEITYTVGLESIPAGFGVKITGTEIVFTYQPVMTTIEGTVVWDLKDNEEDLIPDEVAVDIYDGNNELVDQLTVTPDENGKWSFTSIELPKFREDGETEIAYKLESSVVGFETTVEGTTIKNTLKTVKVTGNVVWKMQGYDESLIPESVIVRVKKGDKVVDEIEVFGDVWTFASRDLPMFEKDGTTVVTYTIEEVEFDGFDVDIDGTTITNTFIPKLTTVSGNVVWELKGNKDELIPESVKVFIKDNEATVKTIEVSGEDGWNYDASELPMYRFDGITPITYTVEAEAVDGFTKAISGTKVTYTLETVDVTAEVIWEDYWNNDGFRPATVEVKLLADGEVIDTVSVSESTDWSYQWKNLPQKVAGDQIAYNVTGEKVEKYTVDFRPSEYETLVFRLTYTHEPEMTEVSVEKIWDDSDNKEGFRPDVVFVRLLANGEEVATAELCDGNEWKHTWIDYKYKEGKEIKFTVKEAQVANYKAPVVEKISETGWAFTVTNSRDYEETEVKVTKVWDDSDNEEGFRPDSVTINLVKNGKVLESIELNAGNEWTYTWKKLQKYENGKAVSYTVTEERVEHYETSIAQAKDGAFTYLVTNHRDVEKTQVRVELIWEDTDNKEGFRPDDVIVKLLANGEEAGTATLTGDGEWKFIWNDLNKFADGEEIEYTLEEAQLPNYKVPVIVKISENEWIYTVTNGREFEETEVKVTKVWDDSNNEEGFRPDSVTVNLRKGTAVLDSVELNADNNWSYSWTKLQKYENGKAINYAVTEDPVANYSTQITKATDGTFTYTVKNSRTVEKTIVSVEKIWDDSDNKEGFRPNEVTVKLLANGEEVGEVTLNADNEWKHTWLDLNKFADGEEIEYTVSEAQVANYKIPVIEKISENEWIYTVTNGREFEETEVKVTKVWDDEQNVEGFRTKNVTVTLKKGATVLESVELNAENNWSYTWTKLQKYENGVAVNYTVTEDPVANYSTQITKATDGTFTFTVKNSRTVEKTQVSVEKIWDDSDNKEGFRPNEVTVKLLANGEEVGEVTLNSDNEWQHTWVDLNKFANGEEIEYTVEEAQLPNYKAPVIVKSSETEWAYTVTNGRDFEETEVKVTKVWDDSNNEEGFRPGSVTVNLKKGDRVLKTVELNKENNWSYTWTKLQKYENGVAVNYTVTEDPVANYSTQITKATDGTFTYTVKNSRTVEKTQVSVEKIWDDSDNKEGFRPENVTIKLLANGEEAGTATLSEDNEWKYTWTGLNKFANGEEIEYTVEEAQLSNYKAPVIVKSSETEWAYTVTNGRDFEETEVKVTKVWDDSNNEEGFRPDSVTVNLKKGDRVLKTVELNKENNWSYIWTKLQKYENGKAINYTVTEDPVANYSTQITKATDGTFTYTVKNSRTVEKTQVSVEKIWDDADNQDGYRPGNVTIELFANSEKAGEVTLNADNEWKHTWLDLNKFAKGEEIEYTVKEPQIEKYEEPVVSKISATEWAYTVTNSHKTEETEVKVTKVWDDADNQDGYRTSDVTVNLLADGEVIDTVTLSEENDWSYTWTKLDKKKAGKEIDYTVTEDGVAKYTTEISKATDGTFTYTITNSHKTEETEVKVTKVWDDADNQDGYRTSDVTVNLLADGEVIDTVTLSEENNWSYTWTKLDKKVAGKNIDYTVTEEKVSEYETEIVKASDDVIGGVVGDTSDGNATNQYNTGEVTESTDDGTFSYIITNSHTPETISPIVKVVWEDEDDRNGKRPESVDSVLVNDEEESKGTVTLGLETEWTETAKEPVAKYKNGGTPVKYTWTITSELPAGYEVVDTAEDGLTTTITIAYIAKPVKLPLEVVKVLTGREWNEKDTFEFTLAADAENPEGAELPEVTVVNATAETKTVAFDEIVFSKRGTYKFTITETKGTLDGVSYDTVAKELVVVVEDDGVGSLYIDEVTNKGSVEITNVYSSVGAIQFAAKKVLDGRELKDGEFTFVLKNEAGEVLQTATCDKDGKISFEPIAYTEKDMVVDGKIVATREYTYTISEVKPEGEKYDALIVYDESVKTIKVTLTDNQDGTITADAKTTDANITFTNVKLAEYEITFVDEDGTTVLKAARKYVVGTKAADVEKPVDPTKKEDDSFTYEFSGWTPEISDVAGDVTYKATYKATAKPGVYYLVGDAPSAQKGNGNGLVMQFKRTVKDEITFDQFDGISFNGKVLSKDLYKAVKGSVIITVPQEFINSLPDGKNEVIVTFKDGDPVKVSMEILPAQSSEDDPVDPNKTEEEKKVSPKTADTMVYGWMIVLLGISGVTVLLVIRRRREEEEQIGM